MIGKKRNNKEYGRNKVVLYFEMVLLWSMVNRYTLFIVNPIIQGVCVLAIYSYGYNTQKCCMAISLWWLAIEQWHFIIDKIWHDIISIAGHVTYRSRVQSSIPYNEASLQVFPLNTCWLFKITWINFRQVPFPARFYSFSVGQLYLEWFIFFKSKEIQQRASCTLMTMQLHVCV